MFSKFIKRAVQFYTDLKIVGKLLIGFGVILATVFGMIALNQTSIQQANSTLNQVIANELNPLIYLNDIRSNLSEMEVATRDAWLKKDETSLNYIKNVMLPTTIKPNVEYSFDRVMEIELKRGGLNRQSGLQSKVGAAGERRMITETRAVLKELRSYWEQYYQLYQRNIIRPDIVNNPDFMREQSRLRFFLIGGIARLVETNYRQRAVLASTQTKEAYHQQQWYTGLLLAVAVVLALGVSLVTAYTISVPLRRLAEASRQIAEGNLNIMLPEKRGDELGKVAQCFNFMTAELNLIIGEVKSTVQKINDHSHQLVDDSMEANVVTQQLVATLSEVAKGAEQQQSKVHFIHDAVKTVSAFSRLVNETINRVNELSVNSVNQALHGEKVAGDVAAKMAHLKQFMQISEANISQLQALFKEVENMVATVKHIAEQTQLLSLNAAIESARAGKYGRGFSVVADSIGGLADQTRAATDQVQQVVGKVRETFRGVTEMLRNENMGIVAGEQAVNGLEAVFETIILTNQELNQALTQVRGNTGQLSRELSEVVANIEQIAEIAGLHKNGTIQAASSAEEHFSYTNEIISISSLLAGWGGNLAQRINKFRMEW